MGQDGNPLEDTDPNAVMLREQLLAGHGTGDRAGLRLPADRGALRGLQRLSMMRASAIPHSSNFSLGSESRLYGHFSRTGTYTGGEDVPAQGDDEFEQSQVQRAYRRQQLQAQSIFSLLKTISAYLYSDIRKKQRSFGIGVFTVFLVVSFITTLKSMIDVAPIAMLKVGQDQAGSIDLMMRAS